MHYLIPTLAGATFTVGLSTRSTDPILTAIASDFSVSITIAALLSSSFALSYAMVQLVMGLIAERFGKMRVINSCLLLVGIGNLAGYFATSFEVLLASRMLCGIGAGGIIPVVMAFIGDRVPNIAERQVTMSRILAGTLTGGVLGISMSGVIADLAGWRSVFLVIGILVLISFISVTIVFRNQRVTHDDRTTDIRTLLRQYRIILSHPHARICYTAVFLETTCLQGVFPYVSTFLYDLGVPSLSVAGIVLSGFAFGGLVYSSTVKRLLRVLRVQQMMVIGGVLVFFALLGTGWGLPWQVQFAAFVVLGLGFFMTHASIQTFSTEISTDARAIAMSLHSFFVFLGQMMGPIVYGVGLSWLGKLPMLGIGATGFLAVAITCALLLRHKSDAA